MIMAAETCHGGRITYDMKSIGVTNIGGHALRRTPNNHIQRTARSKRGVPVLFYRTPLVMGAQFMVAAADADVIYFGGDYGNSQNS